MRALAEANGEIAPEDIDFMLKLAYRSGLSDNTAVVPAIQRNMDHRPGIEAAREEFEATCFSAAEEALRKARVAPREVKFVITNSSLFNPTPSLGAAIINRFGMGESTIGYSLGGMGCSGARERALVCVSVHLSACGACCLQTKPAPSVCRPWSCRRSRRSTASCASRCRSCGPSGRRSTR